MLSVDTASKIKTADVASAVTQRVAMVNAHAQGRLLEVRREANASRAVCERFHLDDEESATRHLNSFDKWIHTNAHPDRRAEAAAKVAEAAAIDARSDASDAMHAATRAKTHEHDLELELEEKKSRAEDAQADSKQACSDRDTYQHQLTTVTTRLGDADVFLGGVDIDALRTAVMAANAKCRELTRTGKQTAEAFQAASEAHGTAVLDLVKLEARAKMLHDKHAVLAAQAQEARAFARRRKKEKTRAFQAATEQACNKATHDVERINAALAHSAANSTAYHAAAQDSNTKRRAASEAFSQASSARLTARVASRRMREAHRMAIEAQAAWREAVRVFVVRKTQVEKARDIELTEKARIPSSERNMRTPRGDAKGPGGRADAGQQNARSCAAGCQRI